MYTYFPKKQAYLDIYEAVPCTFENTNYVLEVVFFNLQKMSDGYTNY